MESVPMEVGRLDGRVFALEDRLKRFDDKLDHIEESIASLALILAENKGSKADRNASINFVMAAILAAGAWFAPLLDKLWHKG